MAHEVQAPLHFEAELAAATPSAFDLAIDKGSDLVLLVNGMGLSTWIRTQSDALIEPCGSFVSSLMLFYWVRSALEEYHRSLRFSLHGCHVWIYKSEIL